MYIRSKTVKGKTYLQLVESQWINGRSKQVVLKSLGRLDTLRETGQLDGLLRSGMKFSERLAVLDAHEQGKSIKTESRRIGPALIFEKLWQELKIPKVIKGLLDERKYEFSVERTIFITVLNRLCSPGSDRASEKWMRDQKIAGKERLNLHHFYRAMGWLGEALAKEEQEGATPFAPRCMKDKIEERLFAERRDLFTNLDLVFFDTTSIYFEGEGGENIGQLGNTKDHRPDLKQMVVGVVLDHQGNPICCEMWPGNTTDVTTLIPIAERLKERFNIQQVCIVADRGMISEKVKKRIVAIGWKYILGVRMRKEKSAKEIVLSRGGRYKEVYPMSSNSNDPSPLKVKEVDVDWRRYVVCFNEKQAYKDREDREAIIASLEKNLKKGDKSLIGNKGYRRYLRKKEKKFYEIDFEKVKEEARYDGKWVLTTNTQLSADTLALKYKQLLMVEEIFRTMKSILETRPIYHKCDDTIRGHVFCNFFALLLRKKLQDLLEEKGFELEWADIIRDLNELMEIEIRLSCKEYILRSETKGATGKIFQAAGVTLPAKLIQK
ncbi:MAG: IS1634 family transposase [Deltaproteobacteria bacterium]|nr:IS1634 family transposase [Deltaproteobacteria bacterium]